MIRQLPITPELAQYLREGKQVFDQAQLQFSVIFTAAVRSQGLMVGDFVQIGGTADAPTLDITVPDVE